MRSSPSPLLPSLTIAAVLLLAGAPAWRAMAQNALGDGRSLDRNLRQGSGGKNDWGKDWRAEAEFRNAIVTGNVGGGRSFRGSLGYTAPTDFRGDTGSDDQFSFQRDAVSSAFAVTNVRGLNGLKISLDQSTFGQTDGLGGRLIINRSSSGVSGEQLAPQSPTSVPVQDRYGLIRGSLRSVSEFYAQTASQPSVIGQSARPDEGKEVTFLTASNLQGVKPLRSGNPAFGVDERFPGFQGLPPTVREQKQREMEELERRRARTPFDNLVESLQLAVEPVGKPSEETRVKPSMLTFGSGTTPDFLNPKPEEPATGAPGARPIPRPGEPGEPGGAGASTIPGGAGYEFERLMEQLRKRLGVDAEAEARDKMLEKARKESARKDGEFPVPLGFSSRHDLKEPSEDEAKPDETTGLPPVGTTGIPARPPEYDDSPEGLAKRAVELLKRERVRMGDLKPADAQGTAYERHMTEGEAALQRGDYFDAEERFTGALNVREGDPMAAVGRVHAQIGAGLYRSAGLNLRNLLRAYPELIAAQFDPKFMPGGARLDRVRAQLRVRMERASLVGREAAFLFAYVGRQTGNDADVKEGLDRLVAIDAEIAAAEGSERSLDALEETLREVWLASPAAPAPAAPAPAPADDPAPAPKEP